jgi:biofilm PGA synthesis N-glycosyltransferase PgaC
MWTALAFNYLLVYLAIGIVIILPGLLLQFGKEKMSSNPTPSDLSELTVIIPFRNERENLETLLSCFQRTKKKPFQVLFVNDHSEDDGPHFLRQLLDGTDYVVMDLPKDLTGKKEAIRFGLRKVNTPYVLTMDADIQFSEEYFEALEKRSWKDLHVLPVYMIPNHFIGRLAEIDHLLVNALNVCASGWSRPFIASGANLLFKKSAFEKYDRFDIHRHIPSGDDTYLLRDFRNADAIVQVHSSPELSVRTTLPGSLKEFLAQRIRWAAKTGDVKDRLANSIVAIQGLLTITFAVMVGVFISQSNWEWLLFLWLAKSVMDVLFLLPFVVRSKRALSLLWMPVYEWIYPLYAVTIAFGALLFRPKWKGRTIRVR